MNKLQLFFLRQYWKKFKKEHNKEAKMISFIITRIFWLCAYIVKNFGIIVGIIEQAIKLFVSIASMTPTRKDDELAQKVENFFDSWQGKIYSGAEAIVRFYNNIWTKIIK
jgi:hypothetical protein